MWVYQDPPSKQSQQQTPGWMSSLLSWVFERKLSTVFCIQHVLDMNVVLYYEGCSRIQEEPGEQLKNAIWTEDRHDGLIGSNESLKQVVTTGHTEEHFDYSTSILQQLTYVSAFFHVKDGSCLCCAPAFVCPSWCQIYTYICMITMLFTPRSIWESLAKIIFNLCFYNKRSSWLYCSTCTKSTIFIFVAIQIKSRHVKIWTADDWVQSR